MFSPGKDFKEVWFDTLLPKAIWVEYEPGWTKGRDYTLSGQGFFTLICHDLNLIWFNVTANPLPKVTLGVVRASLGQGERPVILNGLLQFTCKRGYNYYKMKKMFKFSFLSLHIFETLIPNWLSSQNHTHKHI